MNRNQAAKNASKRLRAMYDGIPVKTKRTFKPFKFRLVGASAHAQPVVFYGANLEQASEFALIWAEARDVRLESEN